MLNHSFAHRTLVSGILAVIMLAARSPGQTASPSEPDSDRRAALRHITLDMLGRLPTDEETLAFLNDKSPNAYRSLIDRLADSRQLEKKDLGLGVQQSLDRQAQLLNDYVRLLGDRVDEKPQSPTAYMGVGVDAPDDVLRAQLSLPAGTGLVVNYVDPNGPSKDLIRMHDVLQKLDDQILINGEQFSTLVKMHKQGDEVTLTIIRQAKTTPITVKLGEREMAKTENRLQAAQVDLANAVQSLHTVSRAPMLGWSGNVSLKFNSDQNSLTAVRTGPITMDDDKTTAVFLHTASGDFITAFDKPTAKLIFAGPVDSQQEWNSVPEEVRSKIRLWWSPAGDAAATTNGISGLSVPAGTVVSYPDPSAVKQPSVKPSSVAPATQPARVEK